MCTAFAAFRATQPSVTAALEGCCMSRYHKTCKRGLVMPAFNRPWPRWQMVSRGVKREVVAGLT